MTQTMETVRSISLMVPVLPGKRDQLFRFAGELMGARAEEYARSQQSVIRETWHLQETPMGDFLIVNFDAPDPAAVFAGLAESTDPFDVWFRQQANEITGIDFSKSIGALPKPVFHYQRK